MYARHNVIIKSACSWLEDVISIPIEDSIVTVAGVSA